MALVCVAAVLWGTWPLYVRPGGPPGLSMAFLAMLAMALPAPFVIRRANFRDRGAVVALVIIGVADAANAALYFSALSRGPVVVASLTHYLAPLLVALAAAPVLGEPRSARALLTAPVVLLGLFLVMGPSGDGGEGHAMTAALGAGSAVFYAALVLATRVASRTFSPLALTALHAALSAVLLLVGTQGGCVPHAVDGALAWAVGGALVSGLLAAVLFNLGIRRLPAQLTSVLTYLEPLAAAGVGVLARGEPVRALGVMGALLVLGSGVAVALEPTPRPR